MHWVNKSTHKLTDSAPYKKIPLNPDLFTTDSKALPQNMRQEKRRDAANIKILSQRLQEEIILVFYKKLIKFQHNILSGEELARMMHRAGISLRHLGALTQLVEPNYLKEMLVREMVARAAKTLVKGSMTYLRNLANKMNDYNLRKSIAFHLNNIFCQTAKENARQEWIALKKLVKQKFDITIESDVIHKLHLPGLALRILELL